MFALCSLLEINDVHVIYSKVGLVVLLESEKLRALTETPTANVESVLANHTAPSLADPAAAFKGSLGILSWVAWNKVDRHSKGRPNRQTAY